MSYEYEERAFLTEDDFLRIKSHLDTSTLRKELDNKHSYFFVMPNINVSIADSAQSTKVKYKGGQLGQGNGFEEHEFRIEKEDLPEALHLLSALLGCSPQESYQFRINYMLEGNIEIALKYTHMWGFHLEVERVYDAATDEERASGREIAKAEVDELASSLGVSYITDSEMQKFKEDCEKNILRGSYSPAEFTAKYGELFEAGSTAKTK